MRLKAWCREPQAGRLALGLRSCLCISCLDTFVVGDGEKGENLRPQPQSRKQQGPEKQTTGPPSLTHLQRMSLLSDVHLGLTLPDPPPHRLALVSGSYRYYHYGCDGVDDRGWGCGYRTLQTVCSWLPPRTEGTLPQPVPSLQEIQSALVRIGDKPASFAGSRDWIGTVEAALCLDYFYNVPGKLVHVPHGRELERVLEALHGHFQGGGGPVMMGGDRDNSSKGLLGVCSSLEGSHHLLVLDPHFYGSAGSLTREELQAKGWVRWRELGLFEAGSFYNLCLPQFRTKV